METTAQSQKAWVVFFEDGHTKTVSGVFHAENDARRKMYDEAVENGHTGDFDPTLTEIIMDGLIHFYEGFPIQ